MISGLIPMLGAGAVNSGITGATDTYGSNPDGSFDPVGYGGALAGLAGGAGIGALAGRAMSDKAALRYSSANRKVAPNYKKSNIYKKLPKSEQKKFIKKMQAKGRTNIADTKLLAESKGAETKGLSGLLKGGKGGITTAIAENPRLAMGGGAALGAMLGAKLLGGNLTATNHANQTASMQNYANQDATNQQSDAYAIQNGSNISW